MGIIRRAVALLRKTFGERTMARLFGGFGSSAGGPGSFGLWGQSRFEQVQHYRHWVKQAIDTTNRNVYHKFPLVARVHADLPAKNTKEFRALDARLRGRLLNAQFKRKALTPVEAHEELESLDQSHDLVKLLRRPNPFDVGVSFYRKIGLFLELTGNAYVWKVPKRSGDGIAELWVIPSQWVWPRSLGQNHVIDWYDVYPFGGGSGGAAPVRFAAAEVIRIAYENPLTDLVGASPLQAIAEIVDVYESVMLSRFFGMKNGGNVGTVIKFPPGDYAGAEQDLLRMKEELNARAAGETNFNRPLVVGGGAEVDRQLAAVELAYMGGSDQLASYILAAWNISKTLLGLTEGVNRATLFGAKESFYELNVNPRKELVGQALTSGLAPHYPGDDLRIYWPESVANDPDQRRADWEMLLKNVSATPNEVRQDYGLEPYEIAGDNPIAAMGLSELPLNKAIDEGDLSITAAESARYLHDADARRADHEAQQAADADNPQPGGNGRPEPSMTRDDGAGGEKEAFRNRILAHVTKGIDAAWANGVWPMHVKPPEPSANGHAPA